MIAVVGPVGEQMLLLSERPCAGPCGSCRATRFLRTELVDERASLIWDATPNRMLAFARTNLIVASPKTPEADRQALRMGAFRQRQSLLTSHVNLMVLPT